VSPLPPAPPQPANAVGAAQGAGNGKRAASSTMPVYFIDTDEEVTSDEDSDDDELHIKNKVERQKQPRTAMR
jgi:hypothetical protein